MNLETKDFDPKSSTDTITVDVGGVIFTTYRTTLTCRSTYFQALLADKSVTNVTVDRSSEPFYHILSFLRNPSYLIPSRYKMDCDYFGLNGVHYDHSSLLEICCVAEHFPSLKYLIQIEPSCSLKDFKTKLVFEFKQFGKYTRFKVVRDESELHISDSFILMKNEKLCAYP